VENTYRGFVEGFHHLHFPRGFVGLESIRGPQLSFKPFSLDTLIGFRLDTLLIVVYPNIDYTRLVTVRVLAN
jgi:hypothetical protein